MQNCESAQDNLCRTPSGHSMRPRNRSCNIRYLHGVSDDKPRRAVFHGVCSRLRLVTNSITGIPGPSRRHGDSRHGDTHACWCPRDSGTGPRGALPTTVRLTQDELWPHPETDRKCQHPPRTVLLSLPQTTTAGLFLEQKRRSLSPSRR